MTDLQAASGISIVCVFNSLSVRRNCLDRSIEAYKGTASIDFIPVDNTAHKFRTAGAALNHGASRARHDVVVFVHQDVYFHSIDELVRAASFLTGNEWGVLGANGVTRQGRSIGRLRDRVRLIGSNASVPVEVDSLDEVLFMVRRDRVLEHPLTEDDDLAWHAYAVEYGLRMRAQGLRVAAVNLAVTHNSLTINLENLDVAHRRIACLHPKSLPVATTCGRIHQQPPRWRKISALRDHAWRVRWLRESVSAYQLRAHLPVPVVLADIRHDVDLLDYSATEPLHVFNFDAVGGFAEHDRVPLALLRRDRPLIFWSSSDFRDLLSKLSEVPRSASMLVTDLGLENLSHLHDYDRIDSCIAGVHRGDAWLAGGPVTQRLPDEWLIRRAIPMRSSIVRKIPSAG